MKIYDEIRNEHGDLITGRTKLFIGKSDDDGNIQSAMLGPDCFPQTPGTLFIIDDYVADQINKLLFINGELVVKDGETLNIPVKSDLDLEEEELQRQLADIQRRRAEKENEPPVEVDNLPEHDEIINDDLRQSTDT